MSEPTTQEANAMPPAWLAQYRTGHLKVLLDGYLRAREAGQVLSARDERKLAELYAEIDRRRAAEKAGAA